MGICEINEWRKTSLRSNCSFISWRLLDCLLGLVNTVLREFWSLFSFLVCKCSPLSGGQALKAFPALLGVSSCTFWDWLRIRAELIHTIGGTPSLGFSFLRLVQIKDCSRAGSHVNRKLTQDSPCLPRSCLLLVTLQCFLVGFFFVCLFRLHCHLPEGRRICPSSCLSFYLSNKHFWLQTIQHNLAGLNRTYIC